MDMTTSKDRKTASFSAWFSNSDTISPTTEPSLIRKTKQEVILILQVCPCLICLLHTMKRNRRALIISGLTRTRIIARKVLKIWENIAGSSRFVQLSACLRFLPTHLMQYSSVASDTSGGYKLIEELYKNSGIEITPKKAQELFESTVKHLRTIFTHNVS